MEDVVPYRVLCFKYVSEDIIVDVNLLIFVESADIVSFFTLSTVMFSCCNDLVSSSVLDFVSSEGRPSTLSTPVVELLVKVPRESGPPESGSLAVTASLAGPSTASRICSSVFIGMKESPLESERFLTGYSRGSNWS